MKKLLPVILSAILAALLFVGCNNTADPVDTTAPDDTTVKVENTEKEKETKAPETEPPETGPVEPYGAFDIVLGEPVVVYQGRENDQGWGKHQFPALSICEDGSLRISWMYGEDKVGAVGNRRYIKISLDGGNRWFFGDTGSVGQKKVNPLPTGKYFHGFKSYGTVRNVDFTGYEPLATWGSGSNASAVYYGPDLLSCDSAVENHVFQAEVVLYDAETDKSETVTATVNWPHFPVAVYYGNITYTVSGWFGLSGSNWVTTEDAIYTCIYARGLNSEAKTKEEALLQNYTQHSVYVFKSVDGITWDYLSQITADDIPLAAGADGPCEPKMIQMADGSFFMLIRTGSNAPMYWVRSTDNCETWSEPQVFSDFGVLPQLLTLDCGVTLTTYGRPKLMVQATSDPTGLTWQEPTEILLTKSSWQDYFSVSCFYTRMIPLDANTALMAYTDFQYPNKNGMGVRTVLVRKIHVVPKSSE